MVEAIGFLIDAATEAVGDVHPDALELLRLLASLSPTEHGIVLDVLEREVAARVASVAAGDGAVGPLDRTSKLFIRVYAQPPAVPPPTPAAVYRAVLDGLLHIASFPSEMRVSVLGGLADALPALLPGEHAAFTRVMQTLVAAVDPTLVAQTG